RRQMLQVCRRGEVLERLVMRDEVLAHASGHVYVRLRAAREAALEPTPGDTSRVQQVADVLVVCIDRGRVVPGVALVAGRLRVADDARARGGPGVAGRRGSRGSAGGSGE